MEKIIWKSFKLGDLFEWSSRRDLSLKDYDPFFEYSDEMVECITGSKTQDDNKFYKIADLPEGYPIYKNSLVINTNGSIGYCFYYDREFISPTSSVHVLIHKNKKLEEIMNLDINMFFAKTLTHIFANGIYDRTIYLIDNEKFDCEKILLPCIEVPYDKTYIWKENDKYYMIAVDYIAKLNKEAEVTKKELNNLLNADLRGKYELEKQKCISNRQKFATSYLDEKKKIQWKAFKLNDLFDYVTGRDSSIAQKNLDIFNEKNDVYNIAIVTESKLNNGVGFYMKDSDQVVAGKAVSNGLTFATQFGSCNYHDYEYFIIGNTNYLVEKNIFFHEIISENKYVGLFFAKLLDHIFRKSELYGYTNKIDKVAFGREVVVLPCIQVAKEDKYIWEENGKFYTLATGYVNYLYLTAQIEYNNRQIKKYERE